MYYPWTPQDSHEHPRQNPWTEQQLMDIYCTTFLNSLSHYDYPNNLQKYWFPRLSSWMIHCMEVETRMEEVYKIR